MSVVLNQKYLTTASADPSISSHAIHWVLSSEVYETTRRRDIEGWVWIGETEDMVMYQNDVYAIVAFRGTQTKRDIVSDIQISNPANGTCSFERLIPARKMISDIITLNPDIIIHLTGHSLGGAIARCGGEELGLLSVTFNSAAPPSNPVVNDILSINYHIVFDFISAWQSTSVVRIDKGYRPSHDRWTGYNRSLAPIFDAHGIDNFSRKRVGRIVQTDEENLLIQGWYKYLPISIRVFVNRFTSVRVLPPLV